MAVPLGRLDTAGWVFSPGDIVASLFEYYRRSEKSQSNLFKGVVSLPYTLAKCSNNWAQIESDVTSDIVKLFTPYFDVINIRCDVDEDKVFTDPDNPKYTLKISGSVSLKGKTFVLNKIVSVENNMVVGFTDDS